MSGKFYYVSIGYKECGIMEAMEHIDSLEGQVVEEIIIYVAGVYLEVVPLEVAAKKLSYSIAHTRFLCNSLQLISIKICGLWFVPQVVIEKQLKPIMQKTTE